MPLHGQKSPYLELDGKNCPNGDHIWSESLNKARRDAACHNASYDRFCARVANLSAAFHAEYLSSCRPEVCTSICPDLPSLAWRRHGYKFFPNLAEVSIAILIADQTNIPSRVSPHPVQVRASQKWHPIQLSDSANAAKKEDGFLSTALLLRQNLLPHAHHGLVLETQYFHHPEGQ